MKDELRIKFAEAEGWRYAEYDGGWWGRDDGKGIFRAHELPTYDNDNDLCRFVRGMDDETLEAYALHLERMFYTDYGPSPRVHQASEKQKQEAIIKAMELETDGK